MKKIILSLICSFFLFVVNAQNVLGAWEAYTTNDVGEKIKMVVIFSEGFQAATYFHAETGKFISTNGGKWVLEGNTMTETIEFDTETPERVGSQVSFDIEFKEDQIGIVGHDMTLKRIDSGAPGALQGAWLMSGRVRDGKTQTRDTNRPRKTMKILSGTRFQWIAYNTETKQFMGSGGGTYTTVDGKYTENIEFFSRDDSRAGVSLEFNFELIDGKWHHKGFSSKGDPMHEIWSAREQ